MVGEGDHKNLIFDVVVDSSQKLTHEAERTLKAKINESVKTTYPGFNCSITLDKDFTHL